MLRGILAPLPLVALCAVASWPAATLAAPPRYALGAELGPEFDSNARRQAAEEDEPLASGLMRMVLDGELRLRGGQQRLSLSYLGGARIFISDAARAADELVQRASLSWSLGLGPRLRLALLGSYYDAFQRESAQDFRTGSAQLQLAAGTGLTTSSVVAGYQGLQFKPFDDYSFHGVTAGASVSREVPKNEFASWRFTLDYAVALRVFNGGVVGEQLLDSGQPGSWDPCSEPATPSCGRAHQDFAQTVSVSAHYGGEALADLWYAAEINHSNSFGETYTRHAVGAKFTTLLFWGVFFTAKGVLRFSRFRDPVLFEDVRQSRYVDIDDENRSTLLLHLGKDVAPHWTAIVRYSLHTNESSGGDPDFKPSGFQRHLVFLGIKMHYGNDPD